MIAWARAVLSVLALAWPALPVCAQAPLPAQRHTAALYQEAARPEQQRAQTLLQQALILVRQAGQALPGSWQSVCEHALAIKLSVDNDAVRAGRRRALQTLMQQAIERRKTLDQALAQLDVAVTLDPNDAELLYLRARVLMLWEDPQSGEDCNVTRKDLDAIAALRAVIAVDPSFEATDTAFQLGVLQTRLHDFRAAALAYLRAIALSWDERQTAISYANLAEVTMLAGDPAAALPNYQHAVELGRGGPDYALALFGMAVALDRLGEHDAALKQMASAADGDGRTLNALYNDGVFFEPPYERFYYEGLGNEALSQLTPETRRQSLVAAAQGYQAFVSASAPGDGFRTTAEADLADLRQQLLRLDKSSAKRSPQRPSAARSPQ